MHAQNDDATRSKKVTLSCIDHGRQPVYNPRFASAFFLSLMLMLAYAKAKREREQAKRAKERERDRERERERYMMLSAAWADWSCKHLLPAAISFGLRSTAEREGKLNGTLMGCLERRDLNNALISPWQNSMAYDSQRTMAVTTTIFRFIYLGFRPRDFLWKSRAQPDGRGDYLFLDSCPPYDCGI
jgi:hypothetical protein